MRDQVKKLVISDTYFQYIKRWIYTYLLYNYKDDPPIPVNKKVMNLGGNGQPMYSNGRRLREANMPRVRAFVSG